MGQVIRMRVKNQPKPEVVELAADLLRRAETGQITGLIFIAAVTGAKNEIGMCGDFAEDAEYARCSADRGFKALFQYPGVK